MPSNIRAREGFALATAIVAIVLIGLLVAASFFGSIQEFRTGRNTLFQERALAAAEYGQSHVLSDFNTDVFRAQTKGTVTTRTYTVQDGATASVDITKLNMLTFSVVSQGVAAAGTDTEARRRTGMLIRLEVPELPIKGAITTSGKTNITGTGSTSGTDLNPTGWNCDETGPPKAGVVNDVAADVTASGACSGFSCVGGTPKVAVDPRAGDPETYDEFGGIDYDSLTAMANIVINIGAMPTIVNLAPSLVGGVCNKADIKNWGDVNRNAVTPGPCESYFPIIHLKGAGTVEVKNGYAQGLILVDGNLKLTGNFHFYGPIIVKGNFNTDAVGNKVFGGVMAANIGCATNPCNTVTGNAHVQFSRCAILQTLIAHARPVLATRSWADMF